MRFPVILFVSFLFAISPSSAASFDCAKASTKVEKMICANQKLSKADESLGRVYTKLLSKVPNVAWTKKHQKEWLNNYRDRCKDSACLESEYHNRIESLSSDLKALESEKNSSANVCGRLVGFINRGTLEELSVPSMEIPSFEILRTKFGYLDGTPSRYWKMDLNGDGLPEHFLLTDNDPYPSGAYLMSERGPNKAADLSAASQDDSYGDLIAIGEKHFIYSWPPKFWEVNDKGNNLQLVCKMSYSGSEIRIVTGKEAPVCAALKQAMVSTSPGMYMLSGDAKEVFKEPSFEFTHHVKDLPEEELTAHNGLARVDIDNDGKLDNVIRIESQYKGRLPCSATMLAVTNEDATNIDDNKINTILMEELSGYCKPSIEARTYKGIVYIHTLESGGDSLYKIVKGKADKVCELQEVRKYEATHSLP